MQLVRHSLSLWKLGDPLLTQKEVIYTILKAKASL